MKALLALISLFSLQSRAECIYLDDDVEHYSWELGYPDNYPDLEIIYGIDGQSPSESGSLPLYHLPEERESFEPLGE